MADQTSGEVTWPENAWRLRIRLDAFSLDPPAVLYGVFSENPTIQFAADFARLENFLKAELSEIRDVEQRPIVRAVQLAGIWNRGFRVLRGDEVSLLIPGCSDIALMSSAPAGKKWLVTMAVQIGGNRFCWSVPFEAVAGEEVEVTLTETNALALASLDKGHQT